MDTTLWTYILLIGFFKCFETYQNKFKEWNQIPGWIRIPISKIFGSTSTFLN